MKIFGVCMVVMALLAVTTASNAYAVVFETTTVNIAQGLVGATLSPLEQNSTAGSTQNTEIELTNNANNQKTSFFMEYFLETTNPSGITCADIFTAEYSDSRGDFVSEDGTNYGTPMDIMSFGCIDWNMDLAIPTGQLKLETSALDIPLPPTTVWNMNMSITYAWTIAPDYVVSITPKAV